MKIVEKRTHAYHRVGPRGGQSTAEAGSLRPKAYFRWKGVLDRILAAILLIPSLPLIGLLVLLVRLTSRGPGIYRQRRVGQGGRRFMLYKIRSMTADAEKGTGAVWCQTADPRVTPLGYVLRKYHLDEFPQLWNVLQGDMSLVGPRPERPEFVQVLAGEVPGYLQRLAVPPGITGLAQINLPPDTDLASVHRKLVLDLEYIQRAGLWLDLRLLVCTFARILKIPAVRLLGLERTVPSFDHISPLPRGTNATAASTSAPENHAGPSGHQSPATETTTPGNGQSNGQSNGKANGQANGKSNGQANGKIKPR